MNRIDVTDLMEVFEWSKSLNTTPERLRAAVDAVGDQPELVMQHLARAPRRGRVAWTWREVFEPKHVEAPADGRRRARKVPGLVTPK